MNIIIRFNGSIIKYKEPYKGTLEFEVSGLEGTLTVNEA